MLSGWFSQSFVLKANKDFKIERRQTEEKEGEEEDRW